MKSAKTSKFKIQLNKIIRLIVQKQKDFQDEYKEKIKYRKKKKIDQRKMINLYAKKEKRKKKQELSIF